MHQSDSSKYAEKTIRDLFVSQKLSVLSTQHEGQPYASLVAFVASDDLKYLYFATARNTRKYHNLRSSPKVAMLMDSRSNQDSDIEMAVAVTATGTADEAPAKDKDHAIAVYLSRHPNLREFALAESSVLVRVTVESYYLVTRFQEVMEFRPSS